MVPELKVLTVKPFHWCSHHCPYCDSRQELFRDSSERRLGVDDWARVFEEAAELGVEYLEVSGGEPALYKGLAALLWEGKRHGFFISMNATGQRIPEILPQLVEVHLDQVVVSMVSVEEKKHDRIRRTPGSWQGATRAIADLVDSPIRVKIHFIVSRDNYAELPELIDRAFAWGVNGLTFVYPENDAEARHLLMSDADIHDFRERILPDALERYQKRWPDQDQSHANLAGLYASHRVNADLAKGIYWTDIHEIQGLCDKPDTFALIYADGSVLPCNPVEYTHHPIVGNVVQQSLREIWFGPEYTSFRKTKMEFCRLCPIKRATGIAVATRGNPPFEAPIVKQVPHGLPTKRPAVPQSLQTIRIPGKRV